MLLQACRTCKKLDVAQNSTRVKLGTSAKMRNATVLMSGGIDSAACAHFLAQQGCAVNAVFINHGQAAAAAEERAVTQIAAHLDVPLLQYSVSGSAPFATGELVGRNAFLVFAALFLTRARPGLLAMGLHAGTPYYDCSEAFAKDIGKLVAAHTDGKVSFVVPFLTWNKTEVHEYFVTTGIDISLTYSCEAGTEPPCGQCASCNDRKALGC
jgi:7-cyano-7-deazaguanine synthase